MTTSTPEPVIPAPVQLAAKRAFIRTTYQSYAGTLTTGIPGAAAIITFVQDDTPGKWVAAGITVGLALISPLAAGLAAYLNISSKGLPEEYVAAAAVQG